MKALFLAYQDQETRHWFPVARLTKTETNYHLVYTNGARELEGFSGFGRMSNLEEEYVSTKLFPLFTNRVLPKSRPEYMEYLSWLGLTPESHSDLEELARTGGLRATDSLELIPCPEPNESNEYVAYFFARGIRHFPDEVGERCKKLEVGGRLYLMKDFQNPHDPFALLLRTDDPVSLVGYAPKYYAKDFNVLADDSDEVQVFVEKINLSAPMQYRVLCKIVAPWPKFFAACNSKIFLPVGHN
ncbi:HIRAN domain-containing protein [Oleiagrimonas sp. MCCC 1A03011]|uniref:HIRAN domain-containing protein n=1 Tax=Oleiagrimonas sp. MCCC 1A03011 TaxID=1926883 RepID=UPI000DC5ACCA|nr:HIRAN domain-containing protein [Oleiagrimonas sp. MCCC 1A03011]RAP58311.1 hypothetical protein BTJ49_04970 [Oleiagrimonas sp. MCCC 1A03011]